MSDSRSVVVVSGATGFIGRHVAARYAAEGARVVGVARRRADGPWDDFVEADIAELDPTRWTVGHADVIVHAAGLAHDMTGREHSDDAMRRVNVDGARNVARVAAAHGCSSFVLISSVKAMRETTTADVDERGECQPTSPYGTSKLRGEGAVAEVLAAAEVPLAVVRPTPVYGPGSPGNISRLVSLASRRISPRPPRRSGRRTMVHVDDLTDLVVGAAAGAAAGVFIADDGETYTARSIYDAVAAQSTHTALRLTAPRLVLRTAAAAKAASRSMRGRSPAATDDVSRLLDDAVYHGVAARRILGFCPTRTVWGSLEAMVGAPQ